MRICTVCALEARPELDRLALSGASNRILAKQFHVSPAAVLRHKADHLLSALVKAQQAEDVTRATDLLAIVTERDQRALALLEWAERDGDLRAAASLLRVSLVSLELLAKLRGELDERAVINVLALPEWMSVREVLLAALAPFPDARVAVGAAMAQLEGGSNGHGG
jgi:hypothetical protein